MANGEDYRLQHRAPTDDGYSAQLHYARDRFGPDVLERPDLYGAADEETLRQMQAAVDDPDATLRVYRAVPPEHPEINQGDWVTLSRVYAHDHAYVEDGPAWPVVYADVPAGQVWTDGNDPSEYGYGGPDLVELDPYDEDQAMPTHPLDVPAVPQDQTHVIDDVDLVETVQFRPSPGAQAERRVPPTVAPRGPDRGIGQKR